MELTKVHASLLVTLLVALLPPLILSHPHPPNAIQALLKHRKETSDNPSLRLPLFYPTNRPVNEQALSDVSEFERYGFPPQMIKFVRGKAQQDVLNNRRLALKMQKLRPPPKQDRFSTKAEVDSNSRRNSGGLSRSSSLENDSR